MLGLTIYLIIAFIVSMLTIQTMEGAGITGDHIIDSIEEENHRRLLNDNPNLYKWFMITALVILGLLWPLMLIYLIIEYLTDKNP